MALPFVATPACSLQAQVGGVRPAAGGDEHLLSLELTTA